MKTRLKAGFFISKNKGKIKMANIEKKFSDIVLWDKNPRPASNENERAELKANLQHNGQIMPLISRKKGNKSEVIAGQNRLICIGELIKEGLWPENRKIILEESDLDDDEALNIATSENINIPMHPMNQYEAFQRLFENGRSIVDISNSYGTTPKIVEQRLSYAKLNEKARELVKTGVRDLHWASAMTMASSDEQNKIIQEIDDDPRTYKNSHEVKARLLDRLVPLTHALFKYNKSDKNLIRKDLFDDEVQKYMDHDDFWPKQNEEILKLIDKRKKEGWKKVSLVNANDFDIYKYNEGVTEKEKAEVIFVKHENGEIVEKSGLSLRFQEKINSIDDEDENAADDIFNSDSDDILTKAREEINNDSDDNHYVESRSTKINIKKEKAAIVQKIMLEDQKLAIATVVAGLIKKDTGAILKGKEYSDIKDIDSKSPSRLKITDRITFASATLINNNIDPTLDSAQLIPLLYKLDMDDLMYLMQVEITRNVSTDLPKINHIYETLLESSNTLVNDHWAINRVFLETLSIKSLKALAEKILPNRLQNKIGKSKLDIIETIAQISDNIQGAGDTLTPEEKDIFCSWSPEDLIGTQIIQHNNDVNDGSEIFE